MKIRSFAVNNYRGITGGLDKNKIDFQDIHTIFIFGQNDAGKSTFLKAYEFFYQDAPQVNSIDFYRQTDESKIEIEIEVELDQWDMDRIEGAAPKSKDSYKEYLIDGCRIRLRNEWSLAKGKVTKKALTWSPLKNSYLEKGYASVGLHAVFQSCLPKPIFIKAMPTEEETKKIINEVLKNIAEAQLKAAELEELKAAQLKIKELQEKLYNKDKIKEYEVSVNRYMKQLFPKVQIGIEDVKDRVHWTENKLGREYDIEFKYLDNNGDIDKSLPAQANHVGHGTIRTAIFTLLLMKDIAEGFERIDGRKDYLVLFEEPELFLYPKTTRELRDLIYKVSAGNTPYQVLCASHSSAMIDISKTKSSIVRLIKSEKSTELHQITDQFLKDASGKFSDHEFKQEMYEVLRFNPHICESFYSDEVILVEGPTEEIIIRAYLQEHPQDKFFFVLNCGTVNNIPFYQKILSKFKIRYNVICDTDQAEILEFNKNGNPLFNTGIQGSISTQFEIDFASGISKAFHCHKTTFEPAHKAPDIPEHLRMQDESKHGKPFDANKYWKDVLQKNITDVDINKVPIIFAMKRITGNLKQE